MVDVNDPGDNTIPRPAQRGHLGNVVVRAESSLSRCVAFAVFGIHLVFQEACIPLR